jgi:hypothetical protein
VTPPEAKSLRCPGPGATEIREQHGSPYLRHQGLGRRSLSEATAAENRAHPEFTSAVEQHVVANSHVGTTTDGVAEKAEGGLQ